MFSLEPRSAMKIFSFGPVSMRRTRNCAPRHAASSFWNSGACRMPRISPEAIARRLPNVILVDGRGQPEEAATMIQKLRNETEAAFLAVLLPADRIRWHSYRVP